VILWALFAVALIFDQSALDRVWDSFVDFPIVLQLILWALLLPVMLGLWIWQSDLELGVRLLLVIVIAIGNLAAFSPRPRARGDSIRTDLTPAARNGQPGVKGEGNHGTP
jgi:hypothetical protein